MHLQYSLSLGKTLCLSNLLSTADSAKQFTWGNISLVIQLLPITFWPRFLKLKVDPVYFFNALSSSYYKQSIGACYFKRVKKSHNLLLNTYTLVHSILQPLPPDHFSQSSHFLMIKIKFQRNSSLKYCHLFILMSFQICMTIKSNLHLCILNVHASHMGLEWREDNFFFNDLAAKLQIKPNTSSPSWNMF